MRPVRLSPILRRASILVLGIAELVAVLHPAVTTGGAEVVPGNGAEKAPSFESLGPFNGAVDACISFCGDGKRVVIAGDGNAQVWDVQRRAPITPLLHHGEKLRAATFSPDGKLVLTAGGRTVSVWDTGEGKPLYSLHRGNEVLWAGFSPDGEVLATAGLNAQIWDTRTGRELLQLDHDAAVSFAAFSRDGQRLLTVAHDTPNGSAHVWNLQTGKEVTRPLRDANHDWIRSSRSVPAAFSPDGKSAVLIDFKEVVVWDLERAKRSVSLDVWRDDEIGPIYSVAYSPDGRKVVVAKLGCVRAFEAATGKQLGRDMIDGIPVEINSVSFCGDDNRIVVAAQLGLSGIWDYQTGERVLVTYPEEPGHIDNLNACPAIAINPDATLCVSIWPKDLSAKLWRIPPKG